MPYVVGGAFAMHHFTGIWRHPRGLELFVMPEDVSRALEVLGSAGFATRVVADHWLARAIRGSASVDLVFGSANWLIMVDRLWLERSVPSLLLGVPVRIAPVEELIRGKAYIAGRDRYDGADVVHLILGVRGQLDWEYLVARFDRHWGLLFAYLCLFRFVYPHDRNLVPDAVLWQLAARQADLLRRPAPEQRVCQGTLLDRISYVVDVERGYHDPREELAVARGFSGQEVALERRWAKKVAMGVAERPQA